MESLNINTIHKELNLSDVSMDDIYDFFEIDLNEKFLMEPEFEIDLSAIIFDDSRKIDLGGGEIIDLNSVQADESSNKENQDQNGS